MLHLLIKRVSAAVAVGVLAASGTAFAAFPDKPIRIVVPYPAGGAADTIARAFGDKFSNVTGQPVIVENKGGASGQIGADTVARAAPDGYTLLLTPTTQLTNVGFNLNPPYNAVQDFVGVVGVTRAPLVLATSTASGIKSLADLERIGKERSVAYGSYGAGTSNHLLFDRLTKQLGVDATHIPYKGENPMLIDMLGGQIDMGLYSVNVARTQAAEGKLNMLGVVGDNRSIFLPDLPTLTEQGVKGMDWNYGVGLYASSKVPADRLEKLRELAMQAVKSEDLDKRYRDLSHAPWGGTAQEVNELLVNDTARWNKLLSTLEAKE